MRKAKGSYTIEAAIILPAVLLVIASLYIFFTAMVLEIRLEGAVESVGRSASAYYLAVEKIAATVDDNEASDDDAEEGVLENLLEDAVGSVLWYPISETLVKTWVLSEVGDDWAENSLIQNGVKGVSFFGTRYDEESESIIINVSYTLVVPFLHIIPVSIPVNEKGVHRVWSGKPMEHGKESEEVVYITETGTVYHTSLGCHYLKLSIREVPLSHINSERNESGGKFYPCELCGDGSGTKVFITSYGASYHFERNCSGLKRGIKSVLLSEVGNRSMCKKCASKEGK